MITLKAVSLFELIKGLLVLVISFLLIFFNQTELNDSAIEIANSIHSVVISSLFYRGVTKVFMSDLNRNGVLIIFGILYSTLRLFEAYGLWFSKRWGFTIGILSTGIYLPFEVYEIFRHVTVVKVLITVLNLGILYYLIRQKESFKGQPTHAAKAH